MKRLISVLSAIMIFICGYLLGKNQIKIISPKVEISKWSIEVIKNKIHIYSYKDFNSEEEAVFAASAFEDCDITGNTAAYIQENLQ